MTRTSLQERLESSAFGRAAISVFIATTVASVVVWNLPESEVKREALEVARPYVFATGLNQNWGVFAPDPRRQSLEVVADVRYANGARETISLPHGGRLVGGYWDYRWRKWMESARTDERDDLWEPTAAWFARRAATDGRRPVSVTLVRRWRDNLPPGFGSGPAQEYAYYTYDGPNDAEAAR